MLKVLCYDKCGTCRKALKWLNDHQIEYTVRPIIDEKPSLEEITEWYKASGLPIKRFWNTSGIQYKEKHLKDVLPTMSEEEQLQLLSTDGRLVKRPLIIGDDFVLTGFKEEEWTDKVL